MLGMELDDIGNPLAAAMFWQAARRTADCIGDRHLRVWVRAWEAHHGYWSGRPAEVVTRLADEAAYIAGNKVCRALVEAHMVRAFALASEGDADGGRAALRDLERTVDRLADAVRGDPHAPRWILPAWVKSWGAAYSYALIGDTRRASQEVAQARELCPDGAHGATLNLQLVQALTLITDNDIDAGLNLALTATRTWPPDPPRRRIIVQLLTALPPESRAHPAARELHRLILP